MDLKMEVYTQSLKLMGLLEIQNSVIWEQKAFINGSFSVKSLVTDESRALLQEENILWIEGDAAGIIEHIDQQAGDDGPYITVKGRDLTGILDRRILWGTYDLSGTVQEIMRYLVDDCCINPTRGDTEARKIPGLVLAPEPAEGGPYIRIQKTGGSLLDTLEELGETYQISFGVRFNPEFPRMEFWTRPGVNRSINQTVNKHVFYSTELDDVLSSDYSYDSSRYRNLALVAGEGEGRDRIHVTVEENAEIKPTPPTPSSGVPFVPSESTVVMLTSDGKEFLAKSVSTADGTSYISAYTGAQIDEAVKKALSGGTEGPPGKDGKDGRDGKDGQDGAPGKDATINGVNTLEIKAGDNIKITQQGGVLTISAAGGGGGSGIAVLDDPDPDKVIYTGYVTQADYREAVDASPEIQVLEG